MGHHIISSLHFFDRINKKQIIATKIYILTITEVKYMNCISSKDKQILREVAKKQYEYSQLDINKEKIERWKKHKTFKKGLPMVALEIGGFRDEVYLPRLKCESDFARGIETALYSNFLNYEIFKDDKIVKDYYPVSLHSNFDLFDIKIDRINASKGIGHQFAHQVSDLEEDYSKLKKSTYNIDMDSTNKHIDLLNDAFGDILPIKLKQNCFGFVLTQKLVHLMGLECLMLSMLDCPELFKETLQRATDDHIEYFKQIEKEGLILPSNEFELLGQGTYCYTDELKSIVPSTLKNSWCFMDSQESSSISPEMYNEFLLPYYKQMSEQFGFTSYGCCEPVHAIWDDSLSKIENLRNVSISAWCDQEFMGERLRGKKIMYHRKTSAVFLSYDKVLNEEGLREHIGETLSAAKGCQLEFTQRDILTIHSNEEKARRFIEVIREEIENNWIV